MPSISCRPFSMCSVSTRPRRSKATSRAPFDGVSMRYSFDDAAAPTARDAVLLDARLAGHLARRLEGDDQHPTPSGWSNFDDDEWELYHADVDRSELHNLAEEHPEKVRELVNLWFAEAGANNAFPLDDRSALEIMMTPRPVFRRRESVHVLPRSAEVPEHKRSMCATDRLPSGPSSISPPPALEGVLFSHGRCSVDTVSTSKTPAALRVQLRRSVRGAVVGDTAVPAGEQVILSASFDKDAEDPPGVATGTLSLWHGDTKVGETRIKTQPGKFTIAGEGLCIGREAVPASPRLSGRASLAVHRRHDPPGRVDVSGQPYVDLEREAAAMLMRELTLGSPTGSTSFLSSWSDGPAKRAIVEFVERTCATGRRAPRGACGRVRQRRHAVVRAADADPARLHPPTLRDDARRRRDLGRVPAVEGGGRARRRVVRHADGRALRGRRHQRAPARRRNPRCLRRHRRR